MARGNSRILRVAYNFSGPGAVADAVAAVQSFTRATAIDRDSADRLAIIVEELVANIFDHGSLAPGQCVEMTLARLGKEVSLTLQDPGNAFDPRAWEAPDTVPPADGGGAGLALVNAWTRILSYESAGEMNRLELIIPLAG